MQVNSFAPNQTEVSSDKTGVSLLLSYGVPVACHIAGVGFFKTDHKWSVTTSKHINGWIARHGGTKEKVETKPQEFFNKLQANDLTIDKRRATSAGL